MQRSRFRTIVVAACLAAVVPRTEAAIISVGPYTPSTSSPFVVPVVVTGAVNLASFTFDLAYDPASFRINTACDPFADPFCDFVTGPVTLGTFYSAVASFAPLFVPGFILLNGSGGQTGLLDDVSGAWQDPGPAPSGAGVLAFIEFIAVPGGSPTSPIVVVGPAAVPEPPVTALLVGAAMTLAALRRRRRRSTVPADDRSPTIPQENTP